MIEQTVENDLEQSATGPSSYEQIQAEKDVVTIVLTADNHLGYAAFGQQPHKREELQQRLRQAFQQVTDFAIEQGADLLIQAGDLFDTVIPDERDRSFVAARLAQLKQAGIRTFALGGMRDTPLETSFLLEPGTIDVHGVLVSICGLGVLADDEGDPLAHVQVQEQIERVAIPLLVLHAAIEELTPASSLLGTHARVNRSSIADQSAFSYILAGYSHSYSRNRIGQTEVIVTASTQHIDCSTPDQDPGFVFMGLAADGVRWCHHIGVNSLQLQRLVISARELWPDMSSAVPFATGAINPTGAINSTGAINRAPTEVLLERLQPFCDAETMIQLRLEGELLRRQYSELDLNRIRRFGEERCFALAIDDSALSLLSEQEMGAVNQVGAINRAPTTEMGGRISPREELMNLADEWIDAASDEQEKQALQVTKEELLLALDEGRRKI